MGVAVMGTAVREVPAVMAAGRGWETEGCRIIKDIVHCILLYAGVWGKHFYRAKSVLLSVALTPPRWRSDLGGSAGWGRAAVQSSSAYTQ